MENRSLGEGLKRQSGSEIVLLTTTVDSIIASLPIAFLRKVLISSSKILLECQSYEAAMQPAKLSTPIWVSSNTKQFAFRIDIVNSDVQFT